MTNAQAITALTLLYKRVSRSAEQLKEKYPDGWRCAAAVDETEALEIAIKQLKKVTLLPPEN